MTTIAVDTLRMLLDRPTDPAVRRMAQHVLELLEGRPLAEPPAPTAATAATAGAGDREVSSARGSPGYGYRWSTDRATQTPDPDEMAVLAAIKHLRNQGVAYRRIAERLEAKGAPSRTGRTWNLAMVKIQWGRLQGDPELSAAVANYRPLEI